MISSVGGGQNNAVWIDNPGSTGSSGVWTDGGQQTFSIPFPSRTTPFTIGCIVDRVNGKIAFTADGTTWSNSYSLSAGTGGVNISFLAGPVLYPQFGLASSGDSATINFGDQSFVYSGIVGSNSIFAWNAFLTVPGAGNVVIRGSISGNGTNSAQGASYPPLIDANNTWNDDFAFVNGSGSTFVDAWSLTQDTATITNRVTGTNLSITQNCAKPYVGFHNLTAAKAGNNATAAAFGLYLPVEQGNTPGLRFAILHRPTEVPAILGDLTGSLPPLVVDLVRAIEQGRRSCSRENLGLLAACERAERLGRPLNAVVSVIGAPERAAGGPLAGRPVAVKDIIEVAGVPTRCGSPASSPDPARSDAAVVARLRAAGAEVFATSQCLEYAAGFAHPQVGDTRNPRDPARTSGGSSGGSAALVAAGACALALGTDTGGSIRIPAAYCGIAGLKPTYGLLPVAGVFPLSPACDHVGTLTATAAGAADLLAALADPGALAPPPAGGDGRFTVGVLAAQLTDPSVTPQVHLAVTGALAVLAAAGWRLREITAPWLEELPQWEDALAVIVSAEAAAVHQGRDWGRYAEGTRALLDYGASVTSEQNDAAIRQRAQLSAAIEASLSGVDVLAGPTVGYQAPEQDPPFGAGADSAESRFTGPYNLTGHPAVSIPVPGAGLPAGLQLAGRRGADLALLRAAAAAEELFRT